MSHYVDPQRIVVEGHISRPWNEPESFHDIMAEQLRHAPWLAVSVAFHALVILILLNIPADPRAQARSPFLHSDLAEQQPEIPEPPQEPPVDPIPPTPTDPELQNTDVVAPDEMNRDTESEDDPALDDFDAEAFRSADTPIGIGPGDLGIRGGRCGGRARLGRGRPIPQAIEIALEWLQRHQDADGKWSSAAFMKHCPTDDLCGGPGNPVNDIGITGLALLAFLGDGSSMLHGEHKDSVRRATIWLKDQQQDDGLIGTEAGRQFMYNHAIAALALIESYGLSGYHTLERYAQRATDYICKSRNPYKVWRYYPRDGDNDTSVTGWMVFALKSAKDFDLRVDEDALKYALAWFDTVTDPASGQAGYSRRGEGSSRELENRERFPPAKSEAMTATALLCRIFLGQKPAAEPILGVAADTMLKTPPVWNSDDGSVDLYYWYYASYAMFQLGGSRWRQWRKHMDRALAGSQQKRGHLRGSWDPSCAWGHAGGRVYATALCTLCLQVYYRYNPLIR